MKTAMIVDDDYLVRSYLKMLPSWERAGFRIEADARDGEEALSILESADIDLLVTDITMPLLNGVELIRKIRQTDQRVYIIALSCHDEFEYVKDALKEGADDYVLKNTLNEDSLCRLLESSAQRIEEQVRRHEERARRLKTDAEQLYKDRENQIPEGVSRTVSAAAEFARSHFKEPVGLTEAAQAAGVNPTYLSYLFRKEMGIGFSNFLLNQRIECAMALLRGTNIKVREAAEQSGFHDYHYFAKAFKKINGLSPAEYRRRAAQDRRP